MLPLSFLTQTNPIYALKYFLFEASLLIIVLINLRIIRTITEPHIDQARNTGNTEYSHNGYRMRTAESANMKVLNIQHRKRHCM